jgi:serine/threonine protein kinase
LCWCRLAGELLDAGSFGRVYRARWNGADVAVKVIAHEAARAEEVENEVLLLMGLQHECIVAAYHYVTYARSSDSAAAAAAPAAAAEGSSTSNTGHADVQDSAHNPSCNSSSAAVRKGAQHKARAESQLVMEFCDCGTLAHVTAGLRQQHKQQVQQKRGDQVPVQALLLLQDVARGLQAIHSENVVHGDLVSSCPGDPSGKFSVACLSVVRNNSLLPCLAMGYLCCAAIARSSQSCPCLPLMFLP